MNNSFFFEMSLTRLILCSTIVDCEWDEFSEWSPCSKTCGGGTQVRTRVIAIQESNGGQQCEGTSRESRHCPVQTECPGIVY